MNIELVKEGAAYCLKINGFYTLNFYDDGTITNTGGIMCEDFPFPRHNYQVVFPNPILDSIKEQLNNG